MLLAKGFVPKFTLTWSSFLNCLLWKVSTAPTPQEKFPRVRVVNALLEINWVLHLQFNGSVYIAHTASFYQNEHVYMFGMESKNHPFPHIFLFLNLLIIHAENSFSTWPCIGVKLGCEYLILTLCWTFGKIVEISNNLDFTFVLAGFSGSFLMHKHNKLFSTRFKSKTCWLLNFVTDKWLVWYM